MSRKNGKRDTGKRIAIVEEDGIINILARLFRNIFFSDENSLTLSVSDSPKTAKKDYNRILRNTKKRGGRIIHNGKPNRG